MSKPTNNKAVRTQAKEFELFRKQCFKSKWDKYWVKTSDSNPEYPGLFWIKHKDFLGEIDIAEFYINKKGKSFWMTPGDPSEWAEIATYYYVYEDGTPVYDEDI